METLLLLGGLAGIIQLVIIIVLIVKFFQLTTDISAIRSLLNKQFNNQQTRINNIGTQETKLSNDTPSFFMDGNDITFADGKKGRIRTYPRNKECSIYDEKGKEVIYNDKDSAINALYIFLSTGKITEQERYTP